MVCRPRSSRRAARKCIASAFPTACCGVSEQDGNSTPSPPYTSKNPCSLPQGASTTGERGALGSTSNARPWREAACSLTRRESGCYILRSFFTRRNAPPHGDGSRIHRADSSAGRALPLQGRGQAFDPPSAYSSERAERNERRFGVARRLATGQSDESALG